MAKQHKLSTVSRASIIHQHLLFNSVRQVELLQGWTSGLHSKTFSVICPTTDTQKRGEDQVLHFVSSPKAEKSGAPDVERIYNRFSVYLEINPLLIDVSLITTDKVLDYAFYLMFLVLKQVFSFLDSECVVTIQMFSNAESFRLYF